MLDSAPTPEYVLSLATDAEAAAARATTEAGALYASGEIDRLYRAALRMVKLAAPGALAVEARIRAARESIEAAVKAAETSRMAAALGRLGGKKRSPAKTAAARANGARGGRPSGTAEGRLVAVYPGTIHDDGSLDWTRVTITTRRSSTAAGARLAAKRAGYRLRRAGQPQNEGDWTTTTRDGSDVEVWLVEVV